MSVSNSRMSSVFSSELSSTINSASLFPGNSASSVKELKSRFDKIILILETEINCEAVQLMNLCWTSPPYGLYLHWGNTQSFSYLSESLGTEVTMAECP